MSDENDEYEGTGLNLNKNTQPVGLLSLLKSISQDSFEVQRRNNTSLWSNTDFACRLVLSSNSKECVCTIHRILLQVILRNVLFLI